MRSFQTTTVAWDIESAAKFIDSATVGIASGICIGAVFECLIIKITFLMLFSFIDLKNPIFILQLKWNDSVYDVLHS